MCKPAVHESPDRPGSVANEEKSYDLQHGNKRERGPCKKLKNFVFTDINVGAYFNSHFINLAVDMEKGEGLELARKFNVQAYPTLFFINPKGDIIKTVIGYQTADQLIQQAKSIQ